MAGKTGIVVPSAGVAEGPNIFVRFHDAVNAVKVHKARLLDLGHQCNLLLSTVRHYLPRLVEAGASDIVVEADEIERAMERILDRISSWERLSSRAAFLRQNHIQIGIEQCYRELSACSVKFMVASSMVQNHGIQGQQKVQQLNHQQLMDVIVALREEVRRLQPMSLEASQSPENLLPPQIVGVDGQVGLGDVPEVVPSPRSRAADHSAKVSRISEKAVIEGSQLFFYIGEWTYDGERTTLGCLRDQSPDSQKRFKEWIEASLGLQHPNILNFAGHITINDVVYSVNPNPWIEHGNIREYLRRNPDADRVRLLSEVASGVGYFHEIDIFHGDLCDKNILINRDGKAIVCGFDLSGFSDPGVTRARWFAPEHVTSAGPVAPTEKADIWSFGLLCLEVLTGEDPYHGLSDIRVIVLLNQGDHPEHPGSTAVGLSPKMWDLMESCWKVTPGQRPSMTEIQSTIRDMLPRRDGSQPSTESIGTSIPTLSTSAIDTSPPRRTTVVTPSSLSPLGLTGIPPIHELDGVTSADFLGIVGQQNNTQDRHRRRKSDTSSLPSVPEDPINLGMQDPHRFAPPQPTTSGGRGPSRPSTAPTLPLPPTSPELQRVGSSSSQGTVSSTPSKPGKLQRLIRRMTTQTTAGRDSDPSLPRTSSDSRSSSLPGPPPAKPPSPSRIRTASSRENTAARQPSRMSTVCIDLPQGRNWEPVSTVVLHSLEIAAREPQSVVKPSRDGTVSAGNLEGLVSRVIADIVDPSKNGHFTTTFLTIYQLFATSERLFDILKRRFDLDPVAAPFRYPILLFIERWLKKGFADEDLKCTSMIKELVLPFEDSEAISEKMEGKVKEIVRLIDDPKYVPLRQPKSCTPLRSAPAERPQGVTPTDMAAALTVVEGDRFKCITYWDYVNFTRCPSNVRRIEVFNIVHDLVKVWVQTTVLESDFLEERMAKYEEWIKTAKKCRTINNFSSTSAIVVALLSPLVKALVLTCESKAKPDLYALAKELTPTDGTYQNTLQNLATRDIIPWLDLHLSTLNSSFAHSNPIVEVDGHPLIDVKHCIKIAEQIDTLVQYSPPQTHHTTRPDLLAYVEYSLKSSRGAHVLPNAEERSALLAAEEQVFFTQRKKMKSLGFPWSPPRRKK